MSKNKSKKQAFKYEIRMRKYDGLFEVWTKVEDPFYLGLWKDADPPVPKSQVPYVWVIVGVFLSFKEALKFTKEQ